MARATWHAGRYVVGAGVTFIAYQHLHRLIIGNDREAVQWVATRMDTRLVQR